MRYNPKARLDRSQVRGPARRRRWRRRLPVPAVAAADEGRRRHRRPDHADHRLPAAEPVRRRRPAGGTGRRRTPRSRRSLDNCRTGADANQDRDCALVADVNSIQAFWADALPEQAGRRYTRRPTTIFSGSTNTGCGDATSDVGPVLLPGRQARLPRHTFFEDMLEGQLGAKGGPFSEAYVLAHEYGHHVQNLLGTMGKVRTQQGPQQRRGPARAAGRLLRRHLDEVRHHVPRRERRALILDLTEEDIANALDAAAAVGDDRIQQRSLGPGEPRPVDARLRRAADALVQDRHAAGHPRGLRHLRHQPALSDRTSVSRTGPNCPVSFPLPKLRCVPAPRSLLP